MKKITFGELENLLEKSGREEKKTGNSVRKIIEMVRRDGDRALLALAKKHDGTEQEKIRIPRQEMEEAKKNLDRNLARAAGEAIRRVERYHRQQLPEGFGIKEKGMTIQYRFSPVEKAGIYIPGGQAPLISTAIMTVVPAMVAGVKKIYAASPPSYKGSIHPSILGILGYLGIEDIFAMGGAQAAAAFALGTRTVPKVDIITGPGNKYVDTAKKLLYGTVGIDLPAGPSEVAVFADSSADIDFVEADLLAQSEHTGGKAYLVTTSVKLGNEMGKRIKEGFWLLAKNTKEALEIINCIAPEHLQLMCRNPESLADKAVAGAVFMGNYTPAVLGDYFAGPSHVLPTGRTSRFTSGLSVYTFLRSYAVIRAEKAFYRKNGRLMEMLASTEGLARHANSLSLRGKKK